MKLRYPVITIRKPTSDFSIPDPIEPVMQVRSYLHQLVDELNVALGDIETTAEAAKTAANAVAVSGGDRETAQSDFNAIKALIIKSADIVDAYCETISKRLEGRYVAESDFGTYKEQTAQTISANSGSIESLYQSVQEITTEVSALAGSSIGVNAHIRSGCLEYDSTGAPVYGLEIGQRTEVDGEEVFDKYARFTAEKLSFYDQNDTEVAYISDYKLCITHAAITGSMALGGFRDTVLSDGSVVTRWIGTGGEA